MSAKELSDKELAAAIRRACSDLTELTQETQRRGLKVEIDAIPSSVFGKEFHSYALSAKIERPGEKL